MTIQPRKLQFGRILRDVRVQHGMSGRELARRTGLPQSHISKFESGQLYPSESQISKISAALELSPAQERRMASLHTFLDHDFSPFLSSRRVREGQDLVRCLEEAATTLRSFNIALIPGLLQTRGYIEGVFSTDAYSAFPASKTDIAAAISGRLKRQKALSDTTKQVEFIVHESVFQCRVASTEAMIEQVEFLMKISRDKKISFGLIPFWQRWTAQLPLSGFYLVDRDLVLIELHGGELNLFLEQSILAYERLFNQLKPIALYGSSCERELIRIKEQFLGTNK